MHGGALRLDLESEGENILHCYMSFIDLALRKT